ncbi:unnamed protein product [Pleuronectes platessa]|uniref:Uncharacterized protein n=1 Tax=Pleuronectes platessa TaxID=8262 RepID=A0A9N7VHA8_PLEPL|nr:unnamed protein product [Pleuronectes platessa]
MDGEDRDSDGAEEADSAAATTMHKGECTDNVDPMPFMVPVEKERLEAMNTPHDIKRSCWIKDEKEASLLGRFSQKMGTRSQSRRAKTLNDILRALSAIGKIAHMVQHNYIDHLQKVISHYIKF